MAIGRVAGPMLLSELDRQGIDLNFTTNSNTLAYLDFSNFKMGINTAVLTETLTVNGNISAGNVVVTANTISTQQNNKSLILAAGESLKLTAGFGANIKVRDNIDITATNQNLTSTGNITLATAGVQNINSAGLVTITSATSANITVISNVDITTGGRTLISNVNVLKGNINATDIGTTTPSTGRFTTVNSTALANLANVKVQTLSNNRIVYSNSGILADDPDLLYFNANNTLYVGNIQTSGALSYEIIGANNITLTTLIGTQVLYANTSSPSFIVGSPGMVYFDTNSSLRVTELGITSVPGSRVLYTASNNQVQSNPAFYYDGTTFASNGTSVLGNLTFSVSTISGRATNQDIVLAPLGSGAVSVSFKKITNLGTPTAGTDAATKDYVDSFSAGFITDTIAQGGSNVAVRDDSYGTANVKIYVNNVLQASFDGQTARLEDIEVYGSRLTALAGPLEMIPGAGERIFFGGNSAVTLPIGDTGLRPVIPDLGDLRYNTDINGIEFYNGDWTSTTPIIRKQIIYPDGVTQAYTLNYTANEDGILVNINGVISQAGAGYTVVGTTITFAEVPLTTDIIEIRYLTGSLSISSAPTVVTQLYNDLDPIPFNLNAAVVSAAPVTPAGTSHRTSRLNSVGNVLYQNSGTTVFRFTLSTAYQANTGVYGGQNFLPSTYFTETYGPQGFESNTGGTRYYTVGNTSGRVYEYSTTAAYQFTGMLLTGGNLLITPQDAQPRNIRFKPDGTSLYMVGSANVRIFQYNLSTPWRVNTAVAVGNVSVSVQDTSPQDVYFNTAGTQMFVAGGINGKVTRYDLGTAWQVNTASYSGWTFNSLAPTNTLRTMDFKPDGTKMYLSVQSGITQEYTLSQTSTLEIDSFYVTAYRSAKYTVLCKSAGSTAYQTTNLLLIHNGTTANLQQTGSTVLGSSVATFTAGIDALGVVRLYATTSVIDAVVKLERTYFTDL
jgi:hypothetical protein